MATFLYRTLALLLIQGVGNAPPAPPPSVAPPPETLAVLRVRAADSLDGPAQVALGRAYLQRLENYHVHSTHADTAWERRMLDTADQALARATATLGPPGANAATDSARVLRVRGWADRALAAWEAGGLSLTADSWGPVPPDVRLSPVLEELGENLLRACPAGGVLLTATDADSYAAWYMRYVRGLGTDRLVIPFAVWRDDPVFRARAAVDLKLGPRAAADAWLNALAERRAVCASMGFLHPPELPRRPGGSAKRVDWKAHPLVWVTGKRAKSTPVAPRDFVFAAVQMAVESGDPWGEAALALYGRAARSTPALCEALATFGVSGERSGCRR